MDSRTKNVLFGLGTALAVGAVAYFVSSDAAQEKAEALINRQRAKHFVKDTLRGNKKAMSVVDKMSDEEITNLLGTVDKVSDLEEKLADYSEQLKHISSDVKEVFSEKKKSLRKKIAR